MPDRINLRCRDPFVVVDRDAGCYYLYSSSVLHAPGKGLGFDVFRSTDLEHWEDPIPAFRPARDFWGTADFWAPEVHAYAGRWWMFASFKAPEVSRGTQILVADALTGPFQPMSPGAQTPKGWGCLDGTLWVEDGRPFMVFCHEWLQTIDGQMCVQALAPDLSRGEGEPRTLFAASQAPWTRSFDHQGRPFNRVTDGPFLHRTAAGVLLMLWSSQGPHGYAMGQARSRSGSVLGPWEHLPDPLIATDGGHGMLFTDLAGALMLTYHQPNRKPDERAVWVGIREEADRLTIV